MSDLAFVETLLRDAMSLSEASLVIYRPGVLVEFKTGNLAPGLTYFSEQGFGSWQIGPSSGHHCHLDLTRVDRILFDAEPVPCQGGRLNYTVWFLSRDDCGNPHRPAGLFSVVLDGPYDAHGNARGDLIGAVYRLHGRHRHDSQVAESTGFAAARPQLPTRTAA